MGRTAWITGAVTVMGTVSWAAEWIPKIAPDERAVRSGLYIAPRQPAKNARVEFTVTEPSGIARRSWPVRGGLPIFRGELADPKAIRLLDGEGREVPVHGKITAFWPEKTAKFLCVDFLTDIGAGETRKFALEYGTEVRPSAAGRVAVSEKGGGEIEVSTGAAVFVFRTGADFLSVALKDPAATFRATGRATVCRDEKGSDPKVLQLTIDEARVTESGPVQTTVHLLGHYGPDKSGPAAQGNEETWKYPASLHFRIYGGTGHAYVEHCFGYNGDVFSEFVQSYGLAVTAGPGREFRFGPDAASEAVLPAGSRVCQYAHDRWSIPGEEEKAGKRIGGWAAIVGGGPRALAAVREAWQNWPVAFSAGRDGTLLVEMLGEMPGRALDLRYEAKDRQNEKIPSHSMFFGDKLTLYYSGPDHKMRGQAKGVRKIHELLSLIHI
ncbi:MAG: hypothetical protein N3A38_15905, partial [Planctomycetota bacterium]|nr:hypothetical protein [Planctomycetota bacterium]